MRETAVFIRRIGSSQEISTEIVRGRAPKSLALRATTSLVWFTVGHAISDHSIAGRDEFIESTDTGRANGRSYRNGRNGVSSIRRFAARRATLH
jgi:hypothetical protein